MMSARTTCLLLLGALLLLTPALAAGETTPPDAAPAAAPPAGGLRLSQAVTCETLEAFKPLNISAVFSVRSGSVMCFTAFDVVSRETSIFHNWIRHDSLIFSKKLVLKPPRWSSVSSIQLREADKGPWRVEVRDADGQLLRALRFSITD
jgi:hypothetical protein